MAITRFLSFALGVGTLLLLASVCQAQNSLPVTHPEPVTIQILDGKGGAPLPHLHLLLVAGYDDTDLRQRLWSAEAITDERGQASLPGALKNFALVQVRVAKHKLCQAHGHPLGFSLDRIRHEGLSTPNHCGTIVVEDQPGLLNVFTKAHSQDLAPPPASSDAASPGSDLAGS